MAYDPNNIFAKILRGEIPCDKVYEDEYVLAFRDIQPSAPVHTLVIPKGPYENLDHFSREASAAEIEGFFRAIGEVARQEGVADSGYRLIMNHGPDGGQEVPHLHAHILGGRAIGRMVSS